MPKTIYFYHHERSFGYFSNFYVRPIVIDGVTWPSTETYFQAMKSLDPEVQEHMRSMAPGEAKRHGGQIVLRPDWDAEVGTESLREFFRDEWGFAVERTKDHFMFTALIAKFEQHGDLKDALLNTNDAILIEDAPKDAYWGNGAEKNGLNKLGRQLMLVRRNMARPHE